MCLCGGVVSLERKSADSEERALVGSERTAASPASRQEGLTAGLSFALSVVTRDLKSLFHIFASPLVYIAKVCIARGGQAVYTLSSSAVVLIYCDSDKPKPSQVRNRRTCESPRIHPGIASSRVSRKALSALSVSRLSLLRSPALIVFSRGRPPHSGRHLSGP